METQAAFILPEVPGDRWPANHPLLDLPESDSAAQGLLLTARGPLMLVAKPILTSSREGPKRGAIIFGRLLAITAIAAQVGVEISATFIDGRSLNAGDSTALEVLSQGEASFLVPGPEVIAGYRLHRDLFGRPALLLRVDISRDITARGHTATRLSLLSLMGVGSLITLILIIGLRRLVLNPVRQLTNHALTVGQSADLTARLRLERNDELGVLAGEFDRMVERLAETRLALVDQSFQSGVAEMAGGILHNIGNAITPLKVNLSQLNDRLRETPMTELRQALTELADPETGLERRPDLNAFAILAGEELAATLTAAASQVAETLRQAEHVQDILRDQELFSRSARVLEPLSIANLLAKALQVLGAKWRQGIEVQWGEGLGMAQPVLGARVALQQILVNLLKNAIEAIRERPPKGGGQIRIDSQPECHDSREMGHLKISDNGIGIAPSLLNRIFTRGFTTKTRNSGLGLHWCAVTVAAMDGKLYAESLGVDQGAVLHLLLPCASQPGTEG